MIPVEERLSIVESALAEFIIQTNRSLHRLEREMKDFKDEMKEFKDEMKDFKDEMKDFKDEMKDFKDEMKDFKDEMKEFKDEMKDFKDEMKEFKDEMKEFKDEMKDFKDEARQDRKTMNKQWGELANKMGTLVEDLIAPAVRPVLKKYFGEAVIPDFMLRVQRHVKRTGEKGEFDVIAVGEQAVSLVEAKSRPDRQSLLEYKERTVPRFRKLFPEYKKRPLVPIFASLSFSDELIELATKESVYLLAYREWEYMDILNFEAVQKQQ